MKRSKYYWHLMVLIAASLSLYNPTFIGIPNTWFKFLTYFMVAFLLVCTYNKKGIGDKTFVRSIMLLSICQLLSAYNAYMFKGQPLGTSVLATMQGFAYILFIPMCKSKISLRDIESIIQIFTVGFLLCSVLNHLSPTPLFGSADDGMDRGTTRYRLVGIYWVILFLFMKINKYAIEGKKTDAYWIAASALGIFFSLTRQDIAVSALLGCLLFFMKTKMVKKILFTLAAFCMFSFVLPKITIVKSLMDKTTEEKAAQDQYDNIRLVAAEYYLFEYPRNKQQVLFGVGIPSYGNSSYGNQFQNVQETLRVYREDVGFCGFYFNYGLVATILLIFIFVRILVLKIPPEYIYLKYYAVAFLLLNIASAPSQVNVSIIPFMISLYMVVLVRRKNDVNKIEKLPTQ